MKVVWTSIKAMSTMQQKLEENIEDVVCNRRDKHLEGLLVVKVIQDSYERNWFNGLLHKRVQRHHSILWKGWI